jgi:hypothetical protein
LKERGNAFGTHRRLTDIFQKLGEKFPNLNLSQFAFSRFGGSLFQCSANIERLLAISFLGRTKSTTPIGQDISAIPKRRFATWIFME